MGIDFISSMQQSLHNFEVNVSSFNPDVQFSEENIWGIGYYLLHENKEGFFCHNDFSRSTSGLVEIANQLLRDGSPNERDLNVDAVKAKIDIADNGPWSYDIENDTNEIAVVISDLLEEQNVVKEFRVNIEGKFEKKTIQNSNYANIVQSHQYGRITIELINDENISLIETFGGVQQSDLNLDVILDTLLESIADLEGLNSAHKLPPGKYPTVLSADSAYSLIHESIGHGCEGDQILEEQSFLTDKIGHKVASSNLTITDDPHLRNSGWSEYDDEGTKTKGTLLVEDGILTDYLHTNKTAKILNSPVTGNARTSSYVHPPEPRQSNLFVEPKNHSFEEMIEDIDEGIYFGKSLVASTSIHTGDVHVEAQFARLIENGELSDYLLPISLSGNALDLLSKVSAVGDNVEKFPTECLKSKSRLNIGAYCPPLKVDNVYLQ